MEQAAGASPGGVISLKLAETHVRTSRAAARRAAGTGRGDGRGDRRDYEARDDDAAAARAARQASVRRVGALRRALEARRGRRVPVRGRVLVRGSRGVRASHVRADEARWALACHHPFAENAVLYPKFLALVVVATEREVFRRADAAGAMARARQVALDAEDARRRAWVADTVRVASETADAAATQAKARLRSEHTAESRWATDVARRDATYRARASREGW